jgi:hypothetical protein
LAGAHESYAHWDVFFSAPQELKKLSGVTRIRAEVERKKVARQAGGIAAMRLN